MKSYFNVPNNVDTSNRHLGIDKNVRKNKYEPKAKKKHRIARLRFLNNKRNIEIFRMSLDAMYDHIDTLNQYYYSLKIAEEERIYNIELEKQRIVEQAEKQKQIDIINFNNNVSMMQEQLDLIPIYKQHIQNIIIENQMIEEEQKLIDEMRIQEENDKLVSQFNVYFDEIKRKKDSNIQLLENLKRQQENESILQSYINNYEKTHQRYNDIYNKAVSINNKIIDDKLRKQNLLDMWNQNIISYNNYVDRQSDIISQYKEEYELLLHKEEISKFQRTFNELNSKVLETINNINSNKNILNDIDLDSETNIPTIDKVQLNTTYINHFNSALKDMKNLHKHRINQINQLKEIEQQQKEMLDREEKQKQISFDNAIKSYKEYIEKSRKYNQNILLKEKERLKNLEKQKKEQERILIENKSIKLQKDIITFNNTIEYHRKQKELYLTKLKQQQLEQDRKMKQALQIKQQQTKRSENIKYFSSIEKTIQNVYLKKIDEINKKYEEYQNELIIIEEKKKRESEIAQEKLQKLIDYRNKIKQNYITLENEYADILKTEREKIEHENRIKKKKEDKYKNTISNYNDVLSKIKLNRMMQMEAELKQKEEEIRKQEIEEYEKELAYNNSIQHYTNLLIENKENHDKFKISIEEFKKKEMERLEQIKKDELYQHNKDIVNFSIEFILDSVDIEIESIEYNKIIETYSEEINNYYNFVESRKLELEQIKQKQLQDAEYEKLKLEEYERQVNEYKKLQEEKFLQQIKDMLLQFNINTSKHIELIEKKKHDYELAEKKKREELEQNERLLKQKIELEFQESISFYKNELQQRDQNIIEYENSIIEAKKELENQKIQQEIYLKTLAEENSKRELEREKKIISDFQKSLSEYKTNINKLELEKEKELIAIEEERKRVEAESVATKKALQKKYVDYYNNSLSTINKARDEYNEKQRIAKINYENEQKKILEQIEKDNAEKLEKLQYEYSKSIDIINNKKISIKEDKRLRELAEKKRKAEEAEFILQQKKIKELEYENLKKNLNKELQILERDYIIIQNEEKERQKRLEEEKIIENKKKEEEDKKKFTELESKYSKSLEIYNESMKICKDNLEEFSAQQIKKQEEEEKIILEEQEKIANDFKNSINEYSRKIINFNEMIEIRQREIEEIKVQKELDAVKIKEEEEKQRQLLQTKVIEDYEKELNKFHTYQDSIISSLYEEIKKEKRIEYKNRLHELESNLQDKISNINEDDILKKIDTTINYIKDLNDNKENEDYINQLKHQYDNSYISPDKSKPVHDEDVLYVGENKLSYSNFSNYNKYRFDVVPKIIYQTWPTKNLTKNMAWVVNRLKSTHPDFKYHLFDDNDCRHFIKKHFDMETLWAFDRLIPGAYKADLWRYCAMYVTGGIYLDIKMCPVNGFRFDYLLKSDWYCNDIARGDGFAGIWQGILVSRPKNPIFKYLISTVIDNVKKEFYGDDPLEITGPKMMKRLLNNLRIRVDTPLQIKKYLNKKASTISKREYKVGICIDDQECLLEYDEYRQECLRTGIHYNEAWKNGQIYNTSVLLENYISDTV